MERGEEGVEREEWRGEGVERGGSGEGRGVRGEGVERGEGREVERGGVRVEGRGG